MHMGAAVMGHREAELDGVLHVDGECCEYGGLVCRICATRSHMQGAWSQLPVGVCAGLTVVNTR